MTKRKTRKENANNPQKVKTVEAKTERQKEYIRAIEANKI